LLPECDKPTDEQRIEANKKKYIESKKKAREAKKNGSNGSNGNGSGNSGTQQQTSNGSGSSPARNPTNRPNKWRPPAEGESDQRFIWTRSHGSQPYKFNRQTGRWDMMVSIPASNGGANNGPPPTDNSTGAVNNAASNTQVSSNGQNPAAANAASSGPDVRAQIAEMQRQLQILNDQL
jgi:hypothetical protein